MPRFRPHPLEVSAAAFALVILLTLLTGDKAAPPPGPPEEATAPTPPGSLTSAGSGRAADAGRAPSPAGSLGEHAAPAAGTTDAAIPASLPPGSPARITIHPDEVIGDIDPHLYGNFAEHLGRCIYGGLFEPGSPHADARGFRTDVLAAVRDLRVTLLRWPGGNFVSGYHWEDGIGERSRRPKRMDLAWGAVEDNRFGTDEFIAYCRAIGAEPFICVNLGTGTLNEARYWVEYCNGTQDTYYADLRRRHGHAQPHGVRYWGLGNEMYGTWQMGHLDAADYAEKAREAGKLMKWTDPAIRLIAVGHDPAWNDTVLRILYDHVDYLSLHRYVRNDSSAYYPFLASSLWVDAATRAAEASIRAAGAGRRRPRDIAIAWDEYYVWYRERGPDQQGRHLLEERYNLEDALVIATFLNSFVRHAHIVKMANMAQLVNVIAPIFTSETDIFRQTIYFPLHLFARHAHGRSVRAEVVCETYPVSWPATTAGAPPDLPAAAPYLDVTAAVQADTLVLNVVNRRLDAPQPASIRLAGGSIAGTGTVAEVNGPDIKTANTFGSEPVQTVERPLTIPGGALEYSFPPHSFTQIRAILRR